MGALWLTQNECLQAQMDEVLDDISCFKCNGKFMEVFWIICIQKQTPLSHSWIKIR